MTDPVARLCDLLDLETIETNVFRGVSHDPSRERVFGGQVLAQALVAAGRTVGDQHFPHSLHAYFLRPGDPRIPILYEVDRSRDGRSFVSRRVVAIQHGRQIFHMSVSFQVAEDGLEYQGVIPDVPGPEHAITWEDVLGPYLDKMEWSPEDSAMELRYVDRPLLEDETPQPPGWRIWCRARSPLPDDPLVHMAVAAYASDMILLDTAVRPHGIGWFDQALMMATIDHAMWFHRPFRVDEWLLFDLDSPSTGHARGLAFGGLWHPDGRRVASLAQEGLIRRLSR